MAFWELKVGKKLEQEDEAFLLEKKVRSEAAVVAHNKAWKTGLGKFPSG